MGASKATFFLPSSLVASILFSHPLFHSTIHDYTFDKLVIGRKARPADNFPTCTVSCVHPLR